MNKEKSNKKNKTKIDHKYRDHVISNSLKSQQIYDRVLLSLASGALGISVSFINNLINVKLSISKHYLFIAWAAWVFSLLLLLISHLFSSKAWERTLEQIDNDSLYNDLSKIGEPFTSRIEKCNNWGLIIFILGLFSFASYLFINLEV